MVCFPNSSTSWGTSAQTPRPTKGHFKSKLEQEALGTYLVTKPIGAFLLCLGVPKQRSQKTGHSWCLSCNHSQTISFLHASESSILLRFSPCHFIGDRERSQQALRERLRFTTNLAANEHHYRSFVCEETERNESSQREDGQTARLQPLLLPPDGPRATLSGTQAW